MEWVTEVGGIWLDTAKWVGGLMVVFAVLVRLMPCNPGMYWWRDLRAFVTDLIYWFIVPLVLRVLRTLLVVAGIVMLYDGRDPELLPVQNWPLWVQCIAIEIIQDIMLYGIHRAFHTPMVWRIHAIHHSPKMLDWMTTARFHPINNLLAFGLVDAAVIWLGFSPTALVLLTPFHIAYSALVHANLNWTFGPFKYVFASPVFHRWHHTTKAEGLDKNFASTFPVLDMIFGTFYMPPGRLPEEFGNGDPLFPDDFLGQLLYPLIPPVPPAEPAVPAPARTRKAA